jgi:DNA repair protein RadC
LEKERFLELTINYTSLSEADSKDLDQLQKQYPYSQVIHNLASRGAQDNNFDTYKKLLNVSAVYSTDRSVLRDIITSPRTTKQTSAKDEPVAVVIQTTNNDLHGDALAEEIMHDLERLQELKHNFEQSFEEFQHSKTDIPKVITAKASPLKKKDPLPEIMPEPVAEGEGLLEEIKTKKKITPETTKQKEQIDIIDQFIKKQPSITKNQGSAADASDLAEKNFSLTENIVSETLVEILLRQGKKDKAIEVLKKLIWKFPQKKTIFAAQIEELKK